MALCLWAAGPGSHEWEKQQHFSTASCATCITGAIVCSMHTAVFALFMLRCRRPSQANIKVRRYRSTLAFLDNQIINK